MYQIRPSELYGIDDGVAAFCLDRAVAMFGSRVDNEIQEAQEGKKPAQAKASAALVLERWVGIPARFREPTVTRK